MLLLISFRVSGISRRGWAIFVPANIADGRQRHYGKEFLHHLSIDYGSLAELETHVLIAARLNYIKINNLNTILDKGLHKNNLTF